MLISDVICRLSSLFVTKTSAWDAQTKKKTVEALYFKNKDPIFKFKVTFFTILEVECTRYHCFRFKWIDFHFIAY